MFVVEERDRVQQRLLALAEADPAIAAAAITGSLATGDGDRWSDLDLAFAVDGDLAAALERWTQRLRHDFAALHHWDLPSGASIYRVFLLPDWLEVDISFTPAADFGPRGPRWRTVFGATRQRPATSPPSLDTLAGHAWHHALHARTSIERRRWWQAEYWIGALREQVIGLACRRLGYPVSYTKGAHLLPEELTTPLVATLVRSLDEAELRRALGVAVTALATELERTDAALASRLRPMFATLTAPIRDQSSSI
jgi:predicted nucleotidyltransferase